MQKKKKKKKKKKDPFWKRRIQEDSRLYKDLDRTEVWFVT